METYVKVSLLTLFCLGYFALSTPPTINPSADSFSHWFTFSLFLTFFHALSMHNFMPLPFLFFAVVSVPLFIVLHLDLDHNYGYFLGGIKLSDQFDTVRKLWGVPLGLAVGFVPFGYLAMITTNLAMGGWPLAPYTEAVLDTSLNFQEGENLEENEAANSNSEETDDLLQPELSNNSKKSSKSGKRKNKSYPRSKAKSPAPAPAPTTNEVEDESDKSLTMRLLKPNQLAGISAYNISIQRSFYATLDTIFLLPSLIYIDNAASSYQPPLYQYLKSPPNFLNVPLNHLSLYILLPFLTLLSYRHIEATLLPKLVYYFKLEKQVWDLRYQTIGIYLIAQLLEGGYLAYLPNNNITGTIRYVIIGLPILAALSGLGKS